jgi:formate--tetrahydrofolate ligase
MNDRALRQIRIGLGGDQNGVPRDTGFDITSASEVMSVIGLARSRDDMRSRLESIVLGEKKSGGFVTAQELGVAGAMAAILRDTLDPTLMQTCEGTPVIVHAGPFANISFGNSSVLGDAVALRHFDYVVTEAGFGADLGAEKFFDIKCRKAGLKPAAAVIVATVRAMKMNGGVKKEDLGKENVDAVKKGCANLGRHIENVKSFGVPVVVAMNHFISDTDAEIAAMKEYVKGQGAEAILCKHWANGSAGIEELARKVVEFAESGASKFQPLYPDDMPLFDKINTIVQKIYRGSEAIADKSVRDQLKAWQEAGYGNLPVCMAKTQYSFSTDPNLRGAPTGHVVPVREVRLSAGAGFVVAICGEIMTMPGLPKVPSSEKIFLNEKGQIEGLF